MEMHRLFQADGPQNASMMQSTAALQAAVASRMVDEVARSAWVKPDSTRWAAILRYTNM
jgi:hypothetical protein